MSNNTTDLHRALLQQPAWTSVKPGAGLSGRMVRHLHLETEMRKRHRHSMRNPAKYISTCCDNSSQHDRYNEGNVEERVVYPADLHSDLHVIYQYSF